MRRDKVKVKLKFHLCREIKEEGGTGVVDKEKITDAAGDGGELKNVRILIERFLS